ncbi:hypothetical protein GCM10007390_25090 [Persicitalea jodogahamensis]|uniref:Uncharacterized protein n=1 Tax=Persicitalea jodogahamensis TaxID=402147 RepID=A0A8J3G8Z2_9BACT|nr:hypothetical protein GCM10007390_25090 [Persicitalea jodogahamensis]
MARPTNFVNKDKPNWLLTLIKENDQRVEPLRALRVLDTALPAFGGLTDGYGIPNVHSATSFIRTAVCALVSPESKYHRSKSLAKEVELALQYMLRIQHKDGTVDLLSTNFHSTPDLGFIVKWLVPEYILMQRADAGFFKTQLESLKTFLQRAGEALIVGGIHTPNHRWVVSAALTKLYELLPDPRYAARVEEWLAEQIDMDEDGQYTERSTYIYSPLTNRTLITIARGLKKPELYDYVRRNLDMARYYMHPNGEVVTEASGRQDKAAIGTMEGYYYPYRYLALRDKNGDFAAMCRMIEKTALPKVVSQLNYFLEDPSLWEELPAAKPLPTEYVKAFPYSGLVRIRRGKWDATLISSNPVWLTFHKGNAVLQGVRFAASFFGKGQFEGGELTRNGDEWQMARSLEAQYYQPFPKNNIPKGSGGNWQKLPRDDREKSEIQQLVSSVKVRETAEGIEADIEITGTDGVPVALELIFREGGSFGGAELLTASEKDAYKLESAKQGTYTFQGDTITFGPGRFEHRNLHLRGALPPLDAPAVYLTGFTPFRHTFRLS